MKTKYSLSIFFLIVFQYLSAQIPILNSNSATKKVIYLDFDGQSVSGTSYNTSYNIPVINAAPSIMSTANIILIWKRLSEDYRPFDVNITTDSTIFNAAISNKRIRMIVTSTSAWFGSAGGIAYIGSFSWGGNPATPGFIFENQCAYNPKYIAEACAHEVGHSLSLKHQSTWSAGSPCSKTAEYNPGQGSGITSWAPIMGVGYYKNFTVWHKGTNTTSCSFIQNDHGNGFPGITNSYYLNYLPDDIGDTYLDGKEINVNSSITLDSGLITQPSDIDLYKFNICNNRYMNFSVKPWALDTINFEGANLDIRFKLYDSLKNVIAIDTSLSELKAFVGINLTAGSYYFSIDGGGSSNYDDYGSLGKYFIKITSNNIPNIISNFNSDSVFCVGQNINLIDVSTGTPSNWLWDLTGSNLISSSIQNPSIFYDNPGIYSIKLAASNGVLSSCSISKKIKINSNPTITLYSETDIVCEGKSLVIEGSGATTYSWSPGGETLSSISINPINTTSYSLTGFNGKCEATITKLITVIPKFTVLMSSPNEIICLGQSTSINMTGALNYIISPGAITSNPAIVNPIITTNYTVVGKDINGCESMAILEIKVNDCAAIESVKQLNQLHIYTDELNNKLIIELEKDVSSLEIVNSNGLLIYNQLNIKEDILNINTENWSKGIYFIKVVSSYNRDVFFDKVIIQ